MFDFDRVAFANFAQFLSLNVGWLIKAWRWFRRRIKQFQSPWYRSTPMAFALHDGTDRLHFFENDHILLSWRLHEWRGLFSLPICQIWGVKSSYEEVQFWSVVQYNPVTWAWRNRWSASARFWFLLSSRRPCRKSVHFLEGACIWLII